MSFTSLRVKKVHDKVKEFATESIADAMNAKVQQHGWKVTLTNALPDLGTNENEQHLVILFQVSDYKGPGRTQWPKMNMTEKVAPSILQNVIYDITNKSWEITEYNGKPLNIDV
jgi:hypothetical protein